MEISIKGTAKEIAALIVSVQERQLDDLTCSCSKPSTENSFAKRKMTRTEYEAKYSQNAESLQKIKNELENIILKSLSNGYNLGYVPELMNTLLKIKHMQ